MSRRSTPSRRMSADRVFCQVFFGLPTGAFPSIYNLVLDLTQSASSCIPRIHGTSVRNFSLHAKLPSHLFFTDLCWTVFRTETRCHTSTWSSSSQPVQCLNQVLPHSPRLAPAPIRQFMTKYQKYNMAIVHTTILRNMTIQVPQF